MWLNNAVVTWCHSSGVRYQLCTRCILQLCSNKNIASCLQNADTNSEVSATSNGLWCQHQIRTACIQNSHTPLLLQTRKPSKCKSIMQHPWYIGQNPLNHPSFALNHCCLLKIIEKLEVAHNSKKIRTSSSSRPSEVLNLGANRKHICIATSY